MVYASLVILCVIVTQGLHIEAFGLFHARTLANQSYRRKANQGDQHWKKPPVWSTYQFWRRRRSARNSVSDNSILQLNKRFFEFSPYMKLIKTQKGDLIDDFDNFVKLRENNKRYFQYSPYVREFKHDKAKTIRKPKPFGLISQTLDHFKGLRKIRTSSTGTQPLLPNDVFPKFKTGHREEKDRFDLVLPGNDNRMTTLDDPVKEELDSDPMNVRFLNKPISEHKLQKQKDEYTALPDDLYSLLKVKPLDPTYMSNVPVEEEKSRGSEFDGFDKSMASFDGDSDGADKQASFKGSSKKVLSNSDNWIDKLASAELKLKNRSSPSEVLSWNGEDDNFKLGSSKYLGKKDEVESSNPISSDMQEFSDLSWGSGFEHSPKGYGIKKELIPHRTLDKDFDDSWGIGFESASRLGEEKSLDDYFPNADIPTSDPVHNEDNWLPGLDTDHDVQIKPVIDYGHFIGDPIEDDICEDEVGKECVLDTECKCEGFNFCVNSICTSVFSYTRTDDNPEGAWDIEPMDHSEGIWDIEPVAHSEGIWDIEPVDHPEGIWDVEPVDTGFL